MSDGPPRQIELTELEALKLENLNLRRTIIGAKMQKLMDEGQVVEAEIAARLGIPGLDGYRIDPKTRVGELVNGGES